MIELTPVPADLVKGIGVDPSSPRTVRISCGNKSFCITTSGIKNMLGLQGSLTLWSELKQFMKENAVELKKNGHLSVINGYAVTLVDVPFASWKLVREQVTEEGITVVISARDVKDYSGRPWWVVLCENAGHPHEERYVYVGCTELE